jgi:hypothetical protein
VVVGADGPKKTIRSGLSAAKGGTTLVIKEGSYGEDLNVAGRDIQVRFQGKVNLSGKRPADTPPVAPAPIGPSNTSSSAVSR